MVEGKETFEQPAEKLGKKGIDYARQRGVDRYVVFMEIVYRCLFDEGTG